MGVDYEEYFGCDETGESVEDALEREMLLADDDEPDIDTIEECRRHGISSSCVVHDHTGFPARIYDILYSSP